MYEIFRENRQRVPWNKLMELYRGKWIFLVNLEGDPPMMNENGELETCEPVSAEVLVVADRAYGGYETGIYKELKKYRSISEMDCRYGNVI
jgi:hypothetical protein